MAGDPTQSPLFADVQPTTPGSLTPDTLAPLPDKSETILGKLDISATETLPELSSSQTLETHPVLSPDTTLFGTNATLPELSSSEETPPQSQETLTSIATSIPEKISASLPPEVLKKVEESQVPVVEKTPPPTDPKLAQYLQADTVYQDMIRVENIEHIRLQLAIRYTLLMFAIFLVFAWIVSNRVIMFGFSEFLWLARIRDGLFAVMAGLFSLTIWFGSTVWTRQVLFLAFFRTVALVFFCAVIVALYLPL